MGCLQLLCRAFGQTYVFALDLGSLCSDASGTGVSPVCWLHDSRGRDARSATLAIPFA